jgi:hypothetical protein
MIGSVEESAANTRRLVRPVRVEEVALLRVYRNAPESKGSHYKPDQLTNFPFPLLRDRLNSIEDKAIFYVTDGNIMYLTDAPRFLISCVIQHYAPVVGWGG